MNIREEIQRAIKYGIYLGDLSYTEEKVFLSELFASLIAKKNFCILKDKDRTMVVSSVTEDLAEIFVHEGTLKIIPLSSEGYFKVFMDALEFIAERHKKEVESLKDLEEDESTEEEDWWL